MNDENQTAILSELRRIGDTLAAITYAKPFLTYAQAGELGSVSVKTIRALVSAGKLTRCGFTFKHPLVRRDEVVNLLSTGTEASDRHKAAMAANSIRLSKANKERAKGARKADH